MNIVAVIFAAFCLFVIVAGGILIASTASQSTAVTDTYGNALDANASVNVAIATGITNPGVTASPWILLIAAAVVVIVVIGAFYAISRTWG